MNEVRFPAPVPTGSRVRASVEVVSVHDVGGAWWQVSAGRVDVESNAKTAYVAEPAGRTLV